MPWEQKTRANTAAAVLIYLCVCVCARTYSHARSVYSRVQVCSFGTKQDQGEEDGEDVWASGKTLMSTIWTTAQSGEEQGALCQIEKLCYIQLTLTLASETLHGKNDSPL